MSVVREPQADSADPFGDFDGYTPAPPAESDTYAPPEYRPPEPVETGGGGWLGGLLAAGAARVIGIGIVVLLSGGLGFLRGGVGHDGPPNVPGHVLDACSEAKLVVDPQSLYTGTHIGYDQAGSAGVVTFETPGGSTTWTCHYQSGIATISGLG